MDFPSTLEDTNYEKYTKKTKKKVKTSYLNLITLADNEKQDYTNWYILIVDGTGIGQNRLLTAKVNGNQYKTDKLWDIIPDSTSVYNLYKYVLQDDNEAVRLYYIDVISDTFKNFVELDTQYFNDLNKPISFKSFVGMSTADKFTIETYQIYLNNIMKSKFKNLKLYVVNYKFTPYDDQNYLDLTVNLKCELLNAPKNLQYTIDLKSK